MHITLNGQDRELQPPLTVQAMLEALGINPKAVVVERNLKIIDKAAFDQEPVEEGDRIEIIRLVGGG